MDWICQIKLSILVGIFATGCMHLAMKYASVFPLDWRFDLMIFIGASLAFMLGMKLKLIKCKPMDFPRCAKCQSLSCEKNQQQIK
jgi:hypothetical protein